MPRYEVWAPRPGRAFHRSLIELRRRLTGAGLEVAAHEASRTLVMRRGGSRVTCDFQRGTLEIQTAES